MREARAGTVTDARPARGGGDRGDRARRGVEGREGVGGGGDGRACARRGVVETQPAGTGPGPWCSCRQASSGTGRMNVLIAGRGRPGRGGTRSAAAHGGAGHLPPEGARSEPASLARLPGAVRSSRVVPC